jgi:hypothetical protein
MPEVLGQRDGDRGTVAERLFFPQQLTPDINGEELLSAGKLSLRRATETLREFRIPCGCIKKSL